jgi:hypothetical protein
MHDDLHPFERRILTWGEVAKQAHKKGWVWVQYTRFQPQAIDGRPIIPKLLGKRVQLGLDRPLVGPSNAPAAGILTKKGLITLYPGDEVQRAVYRYGQHLDGFLDCMVLLPDVPADAGSTTHVLGFRENGQPIKANYVTMLAKTRPCSEMPYPLFLEAKRKLDGHVRAFHMMPMECHNPENFNPRRIRRRAKELVK